MIGKKIDFDHAFQFQCMDVAVYYVDWLTFGTYRLKEDANDSVNTSINKLPSDYLTVYKNTPDFMPQKGDIIVYTVDWADNDYGHIGIVYGDISLQSCIVIEQNWDGKASSGVKKRLEEGYVGVSHFIRPHMA